MILYPAIDVLGGKVVRLRQGEYGDSTVYGDDAVTVATTFVEQGAQWVHMVDLDAAKSGVGTNRQVIKRVVDSMDGRARVQVGGGVRTIEDAQELAGLGVSRVVMGSAAVASPSLVGDVSKIMEVAVGLDHRDGVLATHGWTESSGVELVGILDSFPTAAAFIITDISRDGMLVGPDVEGLCKAAANTDVPVIASGGVGSLDHLRALADPGTISGVIVGKALYEGRFTVAQALEALR